MTPKGLSLFESNPELAKQWHPSKNGSLTPHDVGPYSNRKVWWVCPKNPSHEWDIYVYARTAGNGCREAPCSKRPRASATHNLMKSDPEIAAEFHPLKNGDMTPEKITPHSTKRYWWKCQYGHEWLARVDSRTAGTGCRHCGMQTSRMELRLYSELKSLFHKTKLHLHARVAGYECDLYCPSYKLAIELDGYPWHRNKEGRDSKKSEALKQHGLRLIRLRDERLGRIDGEVLLFNCHEDHRIVASRLVSYLCRNGFLRSAHQWRCQQYLASNHFVNPTEYRTMVAQRRCLRPEKSLLHTDPELIQREWNFEANAPLTPDMLSRGSNEIVMWRCSRCGEDWPASIKSRTRAKDPGGCPYCAGRRPTKSNNLKVKHPAIAAEWDYQRNGSLRPEQVTPCSHEKVYWICQKGHSWLASVANRTAKKGTGCNQFPCTRRGQLSPDYNLKKMFPQLAKEWCQPHNGTLRPQDFTPGSDEKVWWEHKCGHIWRAAISSRAGGKRGCPKCRCLE